MTLLLLQRSPEPQPGKDRDCQQNEHVWKGIRTGHRRNLSLPLRCQTTVRRLGWFRSLAPMKPPTRRTISGTHSSLARDEWLPVTGPRRPDWRGPLFGAIQVQSYRRPRCESAEPTSRRTKIILPESWWVSMIVRNRQPGPPSRRCAFRHLAIQSRHPCPQAGRDWFRGYCSRTRFSARHWPLYRPVSR
jgi:hypothetical protein